MNHHLKLAVPRPPELLALLATMKDHRRAQGRRHPLDLILILIIMGIMAGSKSERAICRFIKYNKKALIKALRIDRKEVPTRSVIQGVMQTVDFKELERIFHAWAIRFVSIKAKDFVSLDGKAIRGTVKNGQNAMQNFVSLVSVFASQQKQVLSAAAIHTKKESEIPAVQNILALLHLHDVTFTLDALHCQEKTVNKIVETGNHYLIGTKDNQPKLHREMEKKMRRRHHGNIYQDREESGSTGEKNDHGLRQHVTP